MPGDVVARLYATPRSSQVNPTTSANRATPRSSVPVTFLARRLHDAQITVEHRAALMVWTSAAPVILCIAWFSLGTWFAVGLAVAVLVVPVVFVAARTGRRVRETIRLLPEVIDILGRSLRSGASLRGALRETVSDAPAMIAAELAPIVEALDRGRPLDVALQEWVVRSPLPQVRIVAAALALAGTNQAGASRALDGVGQSLRDRAALTSEIASLTAQASASMQAMVALPAGFLLLDAGGSQRVLRYLVDEPFGQLCLGAGVVLNACGLVWMRSLVARGTQS